MTASGSRCQMYYKDHPEVAAISTSPCARRTIPGTAFYDVLRLSAHSESHRAVPRSSAKWT